MKLWLLVDSPILPLGAPFDYYNFIYHAKTIVDGAWFGAYSNLTLIKEPMYPLFIAASAALRMPLLQSEELLYAFACFSFVVAVGPLISSRWGGAVLFCALLYNPFSFGNELYLINRGGISPSVALLALSCMIAIFVRRHEPTAMLLPWAVGLGLSYAAFSLTREESVWLVPAMLVLATAYVFASRPLRSRDVLGRVGLIGLSAILVIGLNLTIAEINQVNYGWFTTVEVQSPQFRSAYGSLVRIKHAESITRYPVPAASRKKAYLVSPAFRQLQPYLEGKVGKTWTDIGCAAVAECADIGGWWVWAFRDSVALAGHYDNGRDAAAFYETIGREIDDACSRKLIACWNKSASMAPHLTSAIIPPVLIHAAGAPAIVASFQDLPLTQPPFAVPLPTVVETYRDVTFEPLLMAGMAQSQSGPPPNKLAVLEEIENVYQTLTAPFAILGVTIVGWRLLWMLRKRRIDDYCVILGAIATSASALLIILSIIEVTSFNGLNSEYLAPLYPLAIVVAALPAIIELQRVSLKVARRSRTNQLVTQEQ